MQKITAKEFTEIANTKKFDHILLEKDYFVTVILFLLKEVKDIYFKGGTALNKIFLNYARLSEDIDFTVTGNVHDLKEHIEKILKESAFFVNITQDKRVDRFTRMQVHYQGFLGNEGVISVDLNQKGSLLLKPECHEIPHFYPGFISSFSVNTLAAKEMFAEKMRATIERNKPRDHFDLYQIIQRKLPLDLSLVQSKCEETGYEMDITKMFNRAQKLKRRWDEDMVPLLAEEISFPEVMTTLAKHFKLKEEKTKKQETAAAVKRALQR